MSAKKRSLHVGIKGMKVKKTNGGAEVRSCAELTKSRLNIPLLKPLSTQAQVCDNNITHTFEDAQVHWQRFTMS